MNWLNDPQLTNWLELAFGALCGGLFIVAALVAVISRSTQQEEGRATDE